MQIPKNLPQFEDKNILIIVSGVHEARYMMAHSGNLEEVHQFTKEKITYSDREGHFLKRSFGRVFGSGSVYEPPKERELIEFASEFEKQTKKVLASSKPEQIIILRPEHARNIIVEKLPNETKEKVLLSIDGNFYKTKPLEILERIKKELERNSGSEVMSEEAKKILEKGEK